MIIEDSDVHDSSGYGLQIYYHDDSGDRTCNDDTIIRRNRIHDLYSTDSSVTLDQGSRILFYNNLVYNNTAGIRSICQDAYGTQIFNNTFYGLNDKAVDLCGTSNVQNTQIKNNIIANSGSAVTIAAGATGTVTSNNLCYSVSGSTFGCDHSGDPQFNNAGLADFRIKTGSNAKNQGTTLSAVPDDFVKFSRTGPGRGSAYDIGAYEFDEGGGPIETGPTVRYMAPSGSGGNDSNTCAQSVNRSTPKANFGGTGGALACMSPGDTLYLVGGTYSQGIRVPLPSGTGPTAVMTIASAPSEIATLAPSDSAVIDIPWDANKQYITFDRLVFDCTNGGDQCTGVYIGRGNHHIRFTNVEIKSNYNTVVRPESSSGIATSGEGDTIVFQNCNIHGFQRYASYVRGTNWVFDGCEIHHNGAYGIHIYNSGDTTISNNIVRNSFVHHNSMIPGLGGDISSGILISSGSNNQAYNNVVYANGEGNSNNLAGIQVGGNSTSNLVYNNTIYGNGGKCITIDSGSNGAQVQNNLCFNNGDAVEIVNGGASTAFLKNMCESPGGIGCDLVTTNPLFANLAATPPNFQLQPTSPAKDAGTPIALVTTDIAGVSRPQPSDGNYDIGAYEAPAGGGRVSPGTFWVSPSGVDPPARTCTTAFNNIDAPLLTFNAGRACLTIAGDKLFLRAGSYEGSMWTGTQPIANGTSWTNATTIAGYGTEVVTLSLPSATDVVFYFNATNQFIVLDRLILDCHNQANSNGLAMTTGAHHIRFQNGEIRNCHFEPIFIENSDNNEILTSSIHGSAIKPCINLVAGSDNTVLQGNTIHTCPLAGIEAGSPNTGTVMRDNVIHDAGTDTPSAKAGIMTAGAISPVIINNVVYNNYRGIHVQGGTTNDAKVFNNTVHGNATQGIQIDATAGAVVTNNIVAANTIAQIVNNGSGPTPTTNLTTAPPFDPAFPNKFHLTSAATAAIDVGTPLTADVPKDYEGIDRPQGAGYDIGASEFVGTIVPEEPPPGIAIRMPYWRGQGFFWR
jgi:parallel beta-helix repeat protein